MIFDIYKNVNYLEADLLCKKFFAEIPDLIFQFTISSDNSYLFSLISKDVQEFFEMDADFFSNEKKNEIYERIFFQDREAFFHSLIKARKELSPWEIEIRGYLPKKGMRWFKISANTEVSENNGVNFFGRISDITVAKEKELQLRISEERFQFALEASTAGIWDWDLVKNTVFYSSLSLKILELDSSDVFDDPERWDKIVHPDDLPNYYSDIQEHFDSKIPYYENYHRVMTCSGKYKWILDRGKVIERDETGKPLRVIGTHTDISLQKEKELELLKTMKLYSDQNSRLLNFSHIVSHNLNTQAGNIKSILDFIEEDGSVETINEMLTHLRTVSNDLSETILNLTEVIQVEDDVDIIIESLNLSDYINKTIFTIRYLNSDSKAEIINNVPEDIHVNFNPAYLESVLLNFATNAIKYSHPERNAKVVFEYLLDENGHKALKITDNGLGIDLGRYGDLIFGMYKTFHKHKQARGIGLFMTKNQVEAMKGMVFVESEVGVGSTFKIVFSDNI